MVKHPVILRGYHPGDSSVGSGSMARPRIVKRTDAEFLPGLIEGLRQRASLEDLGEPDADPAGDGHLRLLQPVHRAFNLVVFEAACARPGFPRLNPRSIESAGLVVRRVPRDTPLPSPGKFGRGLRVRVSTLHGEEAWQHQNDQPVGWARLSDPLLDPDPARRPRLLTANALINQRLGEILRRLEPLGERVHPLFVAPPEVCEAAGRTLLYGVVPVTSRERVERNEDVEVTDDDVQQILPAFLRALGRDGRPAVSGAFPDLATLNVLATTQPSHPAVQFLQELRLIQFAWRAFDTVEGAGIVNLLNRITLRYKSSDTAVPLGDYLREASARLVLRTSTPSAIALPDEWPQPDGALAAEIRQAVLLSLKARLAQDVPPASRFEEEKASYIARGFVRVRCEDGCPPALQWSEPSAPFRIAPWWENGGPVHTISLPDLDPDKIKKLKPNIAFALPPKLANLLNNMSPEEMLKGKGSFDGPSLGWICSFSIPVITLCAFIVLNIFLSLLHLVFQWLFYIKICLPFPRRSS